MSVTLVTGATGLIGSHVARLLQERGDTLRLTVREGSPLMGIAEIEADRVRCDLRDRRAVRRALRDVDRIFHVAGTASLRAPREALFSANVEAPRVLYEEALRADVQRVVHTSSMAAVGPAPWGETTDERQPFPAEAQGINFVDSKREGEAEALRAAARGLPVVIVNPTHVFGRGDVRRSSTELVRRFMRREIPAYLDGALNVVDVEDVARGHLLADQVGAVGERYLLGNRNFTLDRLFADLGRITGVEPPAIKLAKPVALAMAAAGEALPARPPVTVQEVRIAGLWWAVRSTKAKRELGWTPSHHEDTLEATVEWYREREARVLAPPGTRQPTLLRAAGYGLRRATGIVTGVLDR
ncbi:MAG: NAD-dependent epimerase/dehydratase family protein [Solirubrobacteraceae bacterium]|nr:NAD-dependent epimerase/dehydratase family protein [Solirubrobacteraceae bacterium]